MGAFAEYYHSQFTYNRIEVKRILRKIEEKFPSVTHRFSLSYSAVFPRLLHGDPAVTSQFSRGYRAGTPRGTLDYPAGGTPRGLDCV